MQTSTVRSQLHSADNTKKPIYLSRAQQLFAVHFLKARSCSGAENKQAFEMWRMRSTCRLASSCRMAATPLNHPGALHLLYPQHAEAASFTGLEGHSSLIAA